MIERTDIEKLAELAMLRLSAEEIEKLRGEIDAILAYVSELNAAPVPEAAEPGLGSVYNVTRADEAPHEPGIYTEDLLRAAPRTENGLIQVKRVLP